MRRNISKVICILFLEALIFPVGILTAAPTKTLTTIYVDDDATPPGTGTISAPYTKIQDAIDNATNADIIAVASGVYNEHVRINKVVTLNWHGSDINGTDTGLPIIDGNGVGVVVKIDSSGVGITRFVITNSGKTDLDAGLYVTEESVNVKIIENEIAYCSYGIWIKRSDPVDTNHEIRGNKVSNMQRQGILISYSDANSIFDNIVANCASDGIYLFDCYKNRISGNILRNNTDGLVIDVGVDNDVEQNTCENNSQYGFIVVNTQKTVIKNNNFIRNKAGQALWINCFADKWYHNYWGIPKLGFKIVIGILRGADMSVPMFKLEFNPSPTLNPM
jgi:parallel beta-helix repeat protein